MPCSGAVTSDVTEQGQYSGDGSIRAGGIGLSPNANYQGSPPGVAGGKPQVDNLADWVTAGADADAVFVSLGGNDFGFVDLIQSCLRKPTNIRWGFQCQSPEDRDSWVSSINSKKANLVYALEAIREAAGGAPVYVIDYPKVVKDSGRTCNFLNTEWVSTTVLPTIDQAVTDAARSAGVNSIDISGGAVADIQLGDVFKGHEICSSDPWVNEITAGKYGVKESFHPTAAGHAAIFAAVKSALLDDGLMRDLDNPPEEDTIVPVRPEAPAVPKINGVQVDPWTGRPDTTNWFRATVSAPTGTRLLLHVYSDPILLTEGVTDEYGQWDVEVPLPRSLESGVHWVVASTSDGKAIGAVPIQIDAPPPAPTAGGSVVVTTTGVQQWSGLGEVSEADYTTEIGPDGGLNKLSGSSSVKTTDGATLRVSVEVNRFLWWEFGSATVTSEAGQSVGGLVLFAPLSVPKVENQLATFSVEAWGIGWTGREIVQNSVKLQMSVPVKT